MAKELLKLIGNKSFEEIRDILSEPPYSLKIQEKDDLYLLKYDQINSDMSEPIVNECRGIILEKGTNKVVCYPFDCFYNWGEGRAAGLDPNSTEFIEKMDGSLIKVYPYKGEYRVATNGMIDARDATVEHITGTNFYDLWKEASGKYFDVKNWHLLNSIVPDTTYMFELVHPLSKVVKYYEPDIYLLGCRHNKTFEESIGDLSRYSIPLPKRYPFKTLTDAINTAEDLPFDEEGYIAVDKYFNRVKVKSPAYVATSHMKSGLNSEKNILSLLVKGEKDEMLALFPEFTELVEEVEKKLNLFVEEIGKDWDSLKDREYETRKDFALEAVKARVPGIMFSMKDKPEKSVKEMIYKNITSVKLVKLLNR